MKKIDLHLHTFYSDGTFSPREVVEKAKKMGFYALSITDHDTVEGLPEALEWGARLKIEVVPGVEMSTDVGKEEIHILGYYLDWREKMFQEKLEDFQKERRERNKKLLKRLEDLGMSLDSGKLKKMTFRGLISRLHIARLMVQEGYVASIGEAFERWLNPGRPAHVPKKEISPFEIIEVILKAKGIPVLAHPWLSRRDDLIPEFVKRGLMGIEVYHPAHSLEVEEHYLKIANRYNLLVTGGSDCHGEAKKEILLGKVEVPEVILEKLKEKYAQKVLS